MMRQDASCVPRHYKELAIFNITDFTCQCLIGKYCLLKHQDFSKNLFMVGYDPQVVGSHWNEERNRIWTGLAAEKRDKKNRENNKEGFAFTISLITSFVQ